MIGDLNYQMYAGSDDWEWDESLVPKALHPAPRMIDLPQEMDDSIGQYLTKAAALYWTDYAATAGCLRVSVERIMDHFSVPKVGIKRNGKSGTLSLEERISEFEKINPGNSQFLQALRVVGNLGVHEGKVSQEAMLDVMMIYETALSEIFDKRTEIINEAAQKLIDARGRI